MVLYPAVPDPPSSDQNVAAHEPSEKDSTLNFSCRAGAANAEIPTKGGTNGVGKRNIRVRSIADDLGRGAKIAYRREKGLLMSWRDFDLDDDVDRLAHLHL